MMKSKEGIYSLDGGSTWETLIGVRNPAKIARNKYCKPIEELPSYSVVRLMDIDQNIYLASDDLQTLFSIRDIIK
jgi:hypothetical protein